MSTISTTPMTNLVYLDRLWKPVSLEPAMFSINWQHACSGSLLFFQTVATLFDCINVTTATIILIVSKHEIGFWILILQISTLSSLDIKVESKHSYPAILKLFDSGVTVSSHGVGFGVTTVNLLGHFCQKKKWRCPSFVHLSQTRSACLYFRLKILVTARVNIWS